MLPKIKRISQLFKIYGAHAFRLLFYPLIGKDLWIPIAGQKVWLNFDSTTYYHLIHSIEKIRKLVEAIPQGLTGAIVDVGANHGIFSLLAAQKMPQAQVFALEPYQKVLPLLEKNLAGTNASIVECALAGQDGELFFYANPSADQIGSIIRENVAEFTKEELVVEHKVPAVSLKTFVETEKIANIAVLKLDVQGAEFSILEHADEVLAITDCLLLEIMLIEPSSFELLEKAKKHFPFHKVLNPVIYGADIIFAKRPFI